MKKPLTLDVFQLTIGFVTCAYLDPLFFFLSRSDVLGQFMPLVGRDWTQSGVARLFSAIKVRLCLSSHLLFHSTV